MVVRLVRSRRAECGWQRADLLGEFRTKALDGSENLKIRWINRGLDQVQERLSQGSGCVFSRDAPSSAPSWHS